MGVTDKEKAKPVREEYWYVSGEGIVEHCAELNDKVDDNHYAYGNYFQTAEEAAKIQNKIFDLNHE